MKGATFSINTFFFKIPSCLATSAAVAVPPSSDDMIPPMMIIKCANAGIKPTTRAPRPSSLSFPCFVIFCVWSGVLTRAATRPQVIRSIQQPSNFRVGGGGLNNNKQICEAPFVLRSDERRRAEKHSTNCLDDPTRISALFFFVLKQTSMAHTQARPCPRFLKREKIYPVFPF